MRTDDSTVDIERREKVSRNDLIWSVHFTRTTMHAFNIACLQKQMTLRIVLVNSSFCLFSSLLPLF